MKHIAISIEYAGLTLAVVKNEQSMDCIPLKPIAELLGLRWDFQRQKLTGDAFYSRYLGVCTLACWGAGDQKREQTCIRLDRVAAFLMTLSPAMIRAKGNAEGADFLEAKLTEWADALHDYETFGSAHNPRHTDALLAMRRANAIANVAKIKDAALRRIALRELGVDYQDGVPQGAGKNGELFA